MKKIIFFLLILLMGCDKKFEKVQDSSSFTSKTAKKFEVYKMSEMAALMQSMALANQKLRERIKKGYNTGKFPSHFLQIHNAEMTDKTDFDAFYKEQATLFIKAQKLIYEDPKNAKQHFNDGVSACVRCHEVKCGGQLPMIIKLYIK